MNAVILSFDSNEKQSVICARKQFMKCMRAVESDSVKSARKAKDKLHKACERASETYEQTLHGQEQNRMSHETVINFWSTHMYNHMHCCAEGLSLQCLSFH